jgi:hypothetical protein
MYSEAGLAASRFGLGEQLGWFRGTLSTNQLVVGQWDDALATADQFLAEVEAGRPHYLSPFCYLARARIRSGRDDPRGAVADVLRAVEIVRDIDDPQLLVPTKTDAAYVFYETGDVVRAADLADAVLASLRVVNIISLVDSLHVLAGILHALGRGRDLLEVLPSSDVPWVVAAAAVATGDLRRGADVCDQMGATTEAARDRLWLAEVLLEQNRRGDADVELQRALAFYQSVRATHFVRQCEALLAQTA